MKVAIVGSRNYSDYSFFKQKVDEILKWPKILDDEGFTIISGGARGVDQLAKIYAMEKGYPFEEYKPDYVIFGEKAPLIRNRQIVEECDMVIAFPTKESRGTWHVINLARKAGKTVVVIKV